MYLSYNILIFLRQKVCKISLQHTKDVKLLPGTYLANSFEVRNVPFNDIQTKYQSLWTEEKDLKFL